MGLTLPETNIAPENQWLKDEFPFGDGLIFRGYVSFREVTPNESFSKQDYLSRTFLGLEETPRRTHGKDNQPFAETC